MALAMSSGWDDARHGVDHRDGGLAAAGDEVDVGRLDVIVEVHRRDDVGPDRGRGQVDGLDAERSVAGGVGPVHVGRGRLEHEVRLVVAQSIQQPVHALSRGLQAAVGCALESLAGRVDPDHPAWLDPLRPGQLVHQVRPDVARPHDGRRCLAHFPLPSEPLKDNETDPSPPKSARNSSPGRTSMALVTDPGSTTWPLSVVRRTRPPCEPTKPPK